jgi:hypothetical protein
MERSLPGSLSWPARGREAKEPEKAHAMLPPLPRLLLVHSHQEVTSQPLGVCGRRANRRLSRSERLRPGPNVLEPLIDDVPGDDIPPRHEVVRASVSVLQVVRVLPDIAAEECGLGERQ